MSDDITIPPEALEAAARAIYLVFTEINIGDGEDRWERLQPRFRAEYREEARAACLALLRHWPGAWTGVNGAIILPPPPCRRRTPMADITIPDEAWKAALKEFQEAGWHPKPRLVRAACLAMLKAWPGMWHIEPIDFEGKIILPLPQENTNGES